MVPWTSPGQVLRWWRSGVLGLSQQQAADRLAVQPSALSNWEHGARAISLDINILDKLLGADGVLAGILWAFGSTKGLDPAPRWSHVFPGSSTPVWLWLRTPGEAVEITAEWGVFRMDTKINPELTNGLFVTLGVSVAESPLTIELSAPGWVDFGRGILPDDVSGAEVLSAVDLMSRSSANGRFMELFVTNLAGKFTGSKSSDDASLGPSAPKGLAAFFSGFSRSPRPEAITWSSLPEPIDEAGTDNVTADDRLRYGRLRRARGLSLADVAELLNEKAEVRVGKETLRRFETDVGQPHDRLLPAALDEVLGGGGYLALTALRAGAGSGSVGFPDFWLGPAWIEINGPGREVVIGLRWGDWSRTLRIASPVLLTFTCTMPDAPFRIEADDEVKWAIGLGRRPGAISIDHNWDPSSVDTAQRALSDTESAFMRALKHGRNRRPSA